MVALASTACSLGVVRCLAGRPGPCAPHLGGRAAGGEARARAGGGRQACQHLPRHQQRRGHHGREPARQSLLQLGKRGAQDGCERG